MNALPIELQNMIYSYVGKHQIVSLFDKVIECRAEDAEPENDFYTWWKTQFKSNNFNPLKHLHQIGCGNECIRCRFSLTWNEYQIEGYDGMCARCYQRVYHYGCESDDDETNYEGDTEDEYEDDEY